MSQRIRTLSSLTPIFFQKYHFISNLDFYWSVQEYLYHYTLISNNSYYYIFLTCLARKEEVSLSKAIWSGQEHPGMVLKGPVMAPRAFPSCS